MYKLSQCFNGPHNGFESVWLQIFFHGIFIVPMLTHRKRFISSTSSNSMLKKRVSLVKLRQHLKRLDELPPFFRWNLWQYLNANLHESPHSMVNDARAMIHVNMPISIARLVPEIRINMELIFGIFYVFIPGFYNFVRRKMVGWVSLERSQYMEGPRYLVGVWCWLEWWSTRVIDI